MPNPPTSIRAALVVALCLATSPAPLFGGEEEDAERLINDCGVNSLYSLLRLTSVEVDLSALRRALPAPQANGLSMAEIQAASRRFGVPLRGKRIGPESIPIDRPMIVLLKFRESPGHFVVLEPVGSLGKRVMVLDFPRPPRIIDYADLMNGEDWTGLALAPVTTWERSGPWVAGDAGVVLAIMGLAFPWLRRVAGRRLSRAVGSAPAVIAKSS